MEICYMLNLNMHWIFIDLRTDCNPIKYLYNGMIPHFQSYVLSKVRIIVYSIITKIKGENLNERIQQGYWV